MLRIINILAFALITLVMAVQSCLAQSEKPSKISEDQTDSIIMTWNKDTPETEMNDDINALAEKGITITYADVKRNDKKEITGLKMTYADKQGNKGSMEVSNQKPINTIRFYKQGDEVGFGNPSGNDMMAFTAGDFGGVNGENFIKQFNFGNGSGAQGFGFSFPGGGDSFGKSSSRIVIKEDGKKPLILENGEVIEGGSDYTKEEIDAIKDKYKTESYGFGNLMDGSNFPGMEGLEELKELQKLRFGQDAEGQGDTKEDLDKTKAEMIKAKEEMQKAKKEMEKAKKELQKAKSSLKTQKA